MADRSERLAIIVTAQDLASGKLGKVRGELSQMGTASKLAAVGLAAPIKLARTGSAAFSHLKGQVTGLAGAIGPLAGVAGLVGVTSALTSSISKAAEFGSNVAKVTAVTNLATPVASAMVDTLDKWGITNDKLVPTLAKLEKNVGLIAVTSDKGAATIKDWDKSHKAALTTAQKAALTYPKLAAFQKQYGVSLTDNNGRILDANQLLLKSADYFTSNASATDKATFMAKLWGKSWQDLVPILSKGSAFIRAQEKDSIKLTDTQVKNIAKFRDAQRDFSDTIGDVQVKVGAELMPLLTSGLKAASAWFDAHGDDVAGFFRDAARFAGEAASTAGDVFSAIRTGWESIPAPVRDFLIKGLVADRTIKFLFGMSPISFATGIAGGALTKGLGGILGGFTQRGGSPANPMWVASAQGGIGGGLPGAAGAGAGAAGVGVGLLGASTLIGASVAATVVGSAAVRSAVDQAIANRDVPYLQAAAEAARKHGVSDGNNAALKALQAIAHNTAALPGAMAQDSAEKAQQRRNSVFTSNPTRNELRTKIGLAHDPKEIAKLQSTLDHRIEKSHKQAITVTEAAKRAVTAAVKVAGDVGSTATRTGSGQTVNAVDRGSSAQVAATHALVPAMAAALAAAIAAIPAPQVNVGVTNTTINRTTTVGSRYAPDTDYRHRPGMGD